MTPQFTCTSYNEHCRVGKRRHCVTGKTLVFLVILNIACIAFKPTLLPYQLPEPDSCSLKPKYFKSSILSSKIPLYATLMSELSLTTITFVLLTLTSKLLS